MALCTVTWVLLPGGETRYYLRLIQVYDINTAQLWEPGSCKSQNMPPVERCRWHLSTSQKMPPQVLPWQQMPKATFSQPYLTKNVYKKD